MASLSRKSKRSAGRREPCPGRLRHQACGSSWIVGWVPLSSRALRAGGWMLETMDERYGADQSQSVRDTQWIEEATLAGDVLLQGPGDRPEPPGSASYLHDKR